LPEDQLVTKTYYGLRYTDTWFDLFLRDASGTFMFVSNAVQKRPENAGLNSFPWVPLMRATPNGLAPMQGQQLWSGDAKQELTADKKNKYTVHSGNTVEEIAFDQKDIDWRSKNGAIKLKGTMITPGIQFLLPWREPDGTTDLMYYTTQFYQITGKYDGKPVSGQAMIEHTWGQKNYAETFWVRNRKEYAAMWNTTYDDGTTDMGYLFCGTYGARGAVVANSKTGRVLNAIDLNVEKAEDGRIVFTFPNGPQWEFVIDPSSGMAKFGEHFNIGYGTVQRVGEARKITKATALFFLQSEMCKPTATLGQTAP
jgi:hypothetical protein